MQVREMESDMFQGNPKLGAECVERGAALLDKIRPGWIDTINLDTLNIASGSDCVLGQVFAEEAARVGTDGFGVGMNVLGFRMTGQAGRFGFTSFGVYGCGCAVCALSAPAWMRQEQHDFVSYSDFNILWRQYIAARREGSRRKDWDAEFLGITAAVDGAMATIESLNAEPVSV